MEKEKFSLKDHLFNASKVEKIAGEIQNVFPTFFTQQFIAEVIEKFPVLELKARIEHITHCLQKHLPENFRQAVAVLLKSLPPPCDPTLTDNDFGDFIYAPYLHFVALLGCTKADVDFSLDALEQMTMRFSAEDAIRYFINAFPEVTLEKMLLWSNHAHYHVRRLASEGTRPKLPWCQKILIDPRRPLPILDNLFADPTRFVTRSVANHLNDISKTAPELVVQTLKKWKESKKQQAKEMDFIIKHSLRTLIKNGDLGALSLVGVQANPPVSINAFQMTEKVLIGEALCFDFSLFSLENVDLVVDYMITYQNKSGQMNSKKVYKLKSFSLPAGQTKHITKKHLMKADMTTRTLYAGQHHFALQINGKIVCEHFFWLQ